MNDLRFAFRQLLKNPGFTAVVVLTLALGIGASTAIYSVVNTVLLNPLPGPAPERLWQIAERNYFRGGVDRGKPAFVGVSGPVLEALRANQAFFSDFAWFDFVHLERKTEDFIDDVPGALVSPNFFTFWNVPPMLGRTLAKDEATPLDDGFKPGADSVIVLSYSLWRSLFAGDKGVLGKTIELGGRHFTVIGVMPPHFQFPRAYAKFWVPSEDPRRNDLPNIRVMVRLKPGITEQQTQAMLDTVANRVQKEHSRDRFLIQEWRRRDGLGLWLRPLSHEFTGSYGSEGLRGTLYGLLGAIGFVLLIVCANIANLLLARTERRQHEFAVRAALGAGRCRLMRQLLTESVLLASLGGLGGVLVTFGGMKLLASLIPEMMPRLKSIQVDGHALGFTLLISILTGLAFGLAPALHARRARLNEVLKQTGTSATAGALSRRYRGALIVVEMALTVVLLSGAGLMIQSVVRLLHVHPGFDAENLLFVDIRLPWAKYNDLDREEASKLRNALFAQLHERLGALPGVSAVGLLKDVAWEEKFQIDDKPGLTSVELYRAACGVEESDFFRAARIPLLAGRYFEKRDIGKKTGVAIINESLARLCWPGEPAVGKKFRRPGRRGDDVYEVIGVVGDARLYRYNQKILPTFYRPYHEFSLEGLPPALVVRTQRDPGSLAQAIRKELKAAEPGMSTPGIRVARQGLYDSTQAQRTYMLYLVVFAGVGLLLSALGISGVLAYSVAQRTREIGIRMAVGAERRHVLSMVMKEGAALAGMGVIAGLMAALWLTRLLQSQLFEVSPTDPGVLAGVSLLLLAIALLACLLPARRATRINPLEALRYE